MSRRISLQQAVDYTSGYDSDWFKIKKGETINVQFFGNSEEDVDVFMTHKLEIGNGFRKVICTRDYDDPIHVCPLCNAGLKPEITIMLSMVDVQTKQVLIWDRGKGKGGAFASKIQSIFNRYSPTCEKIFGIERFGEGLDTTYDIFRYEKDDIEPLDMTQFEKPKVLGNVILELSLEQMERYLETGELLQVTKNDENSQEMQPRTRARRG